LINSWNYIDKGIKTPFLWLWGFFAFPTLFAMNIPIVAIPLFLLWSFIFLKPNFYKTRIKLTNDYKKLFEKFKAKSYKFKPKLIYLNNKYIEKDQVL
jgi:hypothetical protein